jgi:hypothetical protein
MRVLDDDLVNIRARVTGWATGAGLVARARPAASQHALIGGSRGARHVRTNLQERGGVWGADAVYTMSSALPRGVQTLDAAGVATACADQGIPTV